MFLRPSEALWWHHGLPKWVRQWWCLPICDYPADEPLPAVNTVEMDDVFKLISTRGFAEYWNLTRMQMQPCKGDPQSSDLDAIVKVVGFEARVNGVKVTVVLTRPHSVDTPDKYLTCLPLKTLQDPRLFQKQ